MRGMLLAQKDLTHENWICDVFVSIFHISGLMSMHNNNICSGNQHPQVEEYFNCFSNMLRSETARFRYFETVEYPQENRKPIRAHYGRKYECPRGKQTRDRAQHQNLYGLRGKGKMSASDKI